MRNRQLLDDDLSLTEHALRAHPKVYWIWNHRMWCLRRYPALSADAQWAWRRELRLVERMLELDARNFHGWNCRRAIIDHLATFEPKVAAQLARETGLIAPPLP